MTISYKLIPRSTSLLIYGKDKEKYVASCQIDLYGDMGLIHTLNGTDFYEAIISLKLQPFIDLNLKTVQAFVSIGHLRLLRKYLSELANIIDKGERELQKHKLRWIEIELIKP